MVTVGVSVRPLTEREQECVDELNRSIEELARALESDDVETAGKCARAVEVDAMALGLMLRGGRR